MEIKKVPLTPFLKAGESFDIHMDNLQILDKEIGNKIIMANSFADLAVREIKNYPRFIREFVWRVVYNSKINTIINE